MPLILSWVLEVSQNWMTPDTVRIPITWVTKERNNDNNSWIYPLLEHNRVAVILFVYWVYIYCCGRRLAIPANLLLVCPEGLGEGSLLCCSFWIILFSFSSLESGSKDRGCHTVRIVKHIEVILGYIFKNALTWLDSTVHGQIENNKHRRSLTGIPGSER